MLLVAVIISVTLNLALTAIILMSSKGNKIYIRQENEHKKFLDLIFQNIPNILFIKDRYSRIVKANNKFISMYPKDKRDKIIGYTTVEDYNPKEAEEFLAEDRKAFDMGYSRTVETIHFPDGEERTLITQKTRFDDDNGTGFILGIATDITEQTQLQEETEKSQAMLRMVTDFFPGMLFVKDTDSRIVYANDKFISMHPLENQHKVIGSTTFESYPKNVQEDLLAYDQEAFKNGSCIKKKSFTFPNGVTMDITINKTPFADNKGKEYLLCMITEN